MKKDIHPKYGPAEITCSCGNKIKTKSTVSKMHVEICSACHPFYTGASKIIDTAGRVDRFKQILEKKKVLAEKKAPKTAKKVLITETQKKKPRKTKKSKH